MDRFDYIIVGAGSAGSVLAERLSADPAINVLLLEAGGRDRHPFIHMPKGMAKLNTSPNHVWIWHTEADDGTPSELWRRGRGLGGSSAVNGMMYFRGQPEDYDGWRDLGADGWGWSDMARAFSAIEDHELGEGGGRGVGGLVGISRNRSTNRMNQLYIEAGQQMGLPYVEDSNGPLRGTRRNSRAG